MAGIVNKQVVDYAARRIIISSAKPFGEVIAALDIELNSGKVAGPAVSDMLEAAKTREDIVKGMHSFTADTRDFIFFAKFAHGAWLNVYFDGESKFPGTVVYILGNPLIAQGILKYDATVGIDIPPRILVQETEQVGTRILYDLSSATVTLAGIRPDGDQLTTLQDLDEKLERTVVKILGT